MSVFQPHLKKTIQTIPHKPGVYRYYDQTDTILYVGKAKDLKKRVSSYFQESRPHTERMMLMLSQIDRIDYTVVENEKEALILEANLIFSLQPKYNVLLKNETSYVYVRKTNDPIPGLFTTRRKFDPQSVYYGPYTKKYAISDILRTLRIIFPYCQEKIPSSKPCKYVSIKQCGGVCAGHETMQEYVQRLSYIEEVLKGNTEHVLLLMKDKMRSAVGKLDFELAALWRDKIAMLEETVIDQKIILPSRESLDILSVIISLDTTGMIICSLHIQQIRDGKINNVLNYILTGTDDFVTQDVPENKTKAKTSHTLPEKHLQELAKSCIMRFLSSYATQESVPLYIQTYFEEK